MKKTQPVFSAGAAHGRADQGAGFAPFPAGGGLGWGHGAGPGHAGGSAAGQRKTTLAFALALCALLAGCSSQPPVPDWQINAYSAAQRAVQSYLSGESRAARREFDQARHEIARTGSPALVARLELLRCAAQVGSTVVEPCTLFDALRQDAAAPELAYDRYLQGQVQPADVALLPLAQQGVAAALLAGGGVKASAAATAQPAAGAQSAAEAALHKVDDPLSQLVAAGVLLRTGQASPAVVSTALAVSSRQGWRRPLMAWLGLQAARAEAAGDATEAARLRRRMDLAGRGVAAP